jgi:hypothetical protein
METNKRNWFKAEGRQVVPLLYVTEKGTLWMRGNYVVTGVGHNGTYIFFRVDVPETGR